MAWRSIMSIKTALTVKIHVCGICHHKFPADQMRRKAYFGKPSIWICQECDNKAYIKK